MSRVSDLTGRGRTAIMKFVVGPLDATPANESVGSDAVATRNLPSL